MSDERMLAAYLGIASEAVEQYERAQQAAPPTEAERKVLWWLGGHDEFNSLAYFGDGHGITSTRVGGKWGETIPDDVLEGMYAKGWLSRRKNGTVWKYQINESGRRVAAMVRHGIPYTTARGL